jgi:prephenate dehydrogenase
VDPLQHDRFVAITSHFPAILASILSKLGDNAPPEFHGPGFRTMTRLGKTSPELLKTFLESNEDQILRASKELQKLLHRWIKSRAH